MSGMNMVFRVKPIIGIGKGIKMSKQLFNNIRAYEMEQLSLEDIHEQKIRQEIKDYYAYSHSNIFRANDNSTINLK